MSLATSIVVPVHNRASLTRRCLDAVLADLPDRCEVIVVDDASTDSTQELTRSYGDAIRSVRLEANVGYARACNEGASAAKGGTLLFLNNDTEPHPGWLDALRRYVEGHPAATVVGAKLLYPTGAVQHAGVTIGQDGYPHNLYAGFPADHPAVNRSRRMQAVTGACMLVRREAFEEIGGFDVGFVNSLEDVDLCLRIDQRGGEVHYCHEAVVTHLESASRGRQDRFERSVELYRERWRDQARCDDLDLYAADGLLEVEYGEAYPLRMAISPHLTAVDAGRENELELLLEAYARQVSDLLGEVVRLTAAVGSAGESGASLELVPKPPDAALGHRDFLREANRLEEEVRDLQLGIERRAGGGDGAPAGFTASSRLGYRRLVERLQAAVVDAVPKGASVLVISRGDRQLVSIEGRVGAHFPQGPEGGYLGHHPRDSEEAIAHLEALRTAGAEYLVLPSTASWWLDHYADFAAHLRTSYPATALDVCTIYSLAEVASRGQERRAAG